MLSLFLSVGKNSIYEIVIGYFWEKKDFFLLCGFYSVHCVIQASALASPPPDVSTPSLIVTVKLSPDTAKCPKITPSGESLS